MNQNDISQFQHHLLTWYDDEFRDLPWRQTADPYKIWVSEIMLQQTQVVKVVPYYKRFIDAFPTMHDLAHAHLDQVLKQWEGLGYYARARNLHKAAQVIVQKFSGSFPASEAEIVKLPGIGEYTTAAIMSIVFNAELPVIDGNVNRVLCRIFAVEVDPKSREGRQIVRQKAELLLARGHAGTYNQAIMELGAMICTPRSPGCTVCPVNTFCQARQKNKQADYPIQSPKKKRPHKHIAVAIIWRNDKILIDQRKPQGLLGGLWEFPGGHVEDGESYEKAVIREVKEELDINIKVTRFFTTVFHQYTHFTISLHAFLCQFISGRPKALGCTDWKWVKMEELSNYAFPRANGKIIEQLYESFASGSI
ncbi:A/G-specific adenine glycosylase [candidate division KSB1 bacterium]|nr:A/G-specific adenine glycosylase [candidate division KSB1 bacterium]